MDAHAMVTFTGSNNNGLQIGQSTGTINNYTSGVGEDQACLRDLFVTDPRSDKVRIQQTKGGLLTNAYEWVLHTSVFKQWRDDAQCRLLWISGDPGKGKTMLLCGIIDAMQKLHHTLSLSYFFCQATDTRINSSVAVLSGLVWLLASQQPALIGHIREQYDVTGKKVFDGPNAWATLTEILTRMVHDSVAQPIYLFIDALDECILGLPALLNFIEESSPNVKWIVTSRNWPEIKEQLDHSHRLSLELNPEAVSAAVSTFIQYKVEQLSKRKRYDTETQKAVQEYLVRNAEDTFLWVALVYERLNQIVAWRTVDELHKFPPGLDTLYDRMMDQVEEADEKELLIKLLGVVATVRRPLALSELRVFVDLPSSADWSQQVVEQCGSFLTIRESTIYFVHQSAKDFLLDSASSRVFPHGVSKVHNLILSKSLEAMMKILRRDMYSLRAPGISIDEITPPYPDPLQDIGYPCVHWVSHLEQASKTTIQDGGKVERFLRKELIYWLEALSLLRSLSQGVVAIRSLERIVKATNASQLANFISDALRLVQLRKGLIENYPLQIYISGLLFSPTSSLIRISFEFELRAWSQQTGIQVETQIPREWSACTQLIEDDSAGTTNAVFSPDGSQLAFGSFDNKIRLWNVYTGQRQYSLDGHSSWILSVVFSPDGSQLASSSFDKTIRLWNMHTGQCRYILESYSGAVKSVVFSPDGSQLASGSHDSTIRLWNVHTGQCHDILESYSVGIKSVMFSPDGSRLASGSRDGWIQLWNMHTGQCQYTIKGHEDSILDVVFSPDGSQLASSSLDSTIRLWNMHTGQCQYTLEGHEGSILDVVFSPDGSQLASSSLDSTIRLWNMHTGHYQYTLEGHTEQVMSIVFSPDGSQLASSSADHTIRLWNVHTGQFQYTLEGHTRRVVNAVFSPDGSQLASSSTDDTIRVWDMQIDQNQYTLEGHSKSIIQMALSPDGSQLASSSQDNTTRLWDVYTGQCQHTLEGHSDQVNSMVFSPDGSQLASSAYDGTVRLWNTATAANIKTFDILVSRSTNVKFSDDGTRLICNGHLLSTLEKQPLPTVPAKLLTQEHRMALGKFGVVNDWVTLSTKRILWLPPEYRPGKWICQNNVVVIGSETGRVVFVSLN